MSGSKDEATFKINIDGNAASASKNVATSAREAAGAISKFEDEAKNLSADLRRLRGNSEAVVAAKTTLKKRIDELKTSSSTLTAELVKQGTSYKAAADAAKKYADATKGASLPNLRGGLGKVGSAAAKGLGSLGAGAAKKLAPIGKKLGEFVSPVTKAIGEKLAPAGKVLAKWGGGAAKALGKVGSAAKEDLASILPSIGTMMGGLATAGALAAAAVAAVGAAFIAGTVALAAFGLGAADAAAKMSRQREALLGTAKDAGNLGDHIVQLAGKVPQGVEELNALSVALSKTRISGKATVSSLNAISQVTGAVDGAAGAKIQELITRNDKFGRMAIGAFELDGTGLDFDSVAQAYADGTKKSLEAAKKELRMGIAPIEAGSEALAKAAEKKFGKLNVANAFSLENAPKKFKEQFAALSSGVNLEPISKALQDAFGQLSPDAPLGAGVKAFMTSFGGGLVDVGAKAIPILLEGLQYVVLWGLKITRTFLETKDAIANVLNGDGNWFEKWLKVGKELTRGLVTGIVQGNLLVSEAVVGLGSASIKAFKDVLGIHSPSKVFADFGEHTTAGYVEGVESGSKRASGAVQGMVDMPSSPAGSSPGVGLSGASVNLTVTINGAPTNDAKAMQGPEFEALMTRSLRNALTAAGAS